MGGSPGNGPATESRRGMPLVPSERTLREGVPDKSNRRRLGKRAVAAVTIEAGAPIGWGDGRDGNGREWAVSTRIGRGEQGQLLG